MADFYVTTASNHPGGSGYYTVKADSNEKAITAVVASLGDKWCFIYDTLEDVHPLDKTYHKGVIQG